MGRQHPPEADAKSGRGWQGEPTDPPSSGSPEPGSSPTPARGREGAREKAAEPTPTGQPSALLTWLEGGGSLPSRVPGAHTTCCLSRAGTSTENQTALPFFASVPNGRRAPGPNLKSKSWQEAEGLQKRPGTSGDPHSRRVGGGGSGGAPWPRAGAGDRTQRSGSPFGRRGTHRLLPSAARPSSLQSPPLAPRELRADRPRTHRGRSWSAGRGVGSGGRPAIRAGRGPPPEAAFAAPPLAPSPLAPPLPASHSKLRVGKADRPRSMGESCLSSWVTPRGHGR